MGLKGKAPLVSHSDFDILFLNAELARIKHGPIASPCIDTWRWRGNALNRPDFAIYAIGFRSRRLTWKLVFRLSDQSREWRDFMRGTKRNLAVGRY